MGSLSYQQWRELLKSERLPAAMVDLDAFDRNLARLVAPLEGTGKKLRVATKSLRVPALIERALAHGGAYVGLMCYSAEEILMWTEKGQGDLLLAYPSLQESDLKALRAAHDRAPLISAVVDSPEGIAALARAMSGAARPFRVLIDVDASLRFFGGLVHFGVRRSPVRSSGDVERLLAEIAKHPSLKAVGAMCYDAQIAGLGDRNPFKKLINPFAGLIRKLSIKSVAKLRASVAAAFVARGVKLELFNGGGTGSINLVQHEACLTELSAGSGLVCSHLFDYYSNVHFEPAEFFALQATRSSDEHMITCQGGGYVASGEPGPDRLPIPYLPEGAKLVAMEGVGEVQTPLTLAASTVSLGEPVLFRHAKAGELAERFNEVLLVAGGKVTARAPTYRGLGRCFY